VATTGASGAALLAIPFGTTDRTVPATKLTADLRGSAGAYASLIKDYKPMGVDYSKSFLANATFARISGVMFVLVGIWFIVGSPIMASQMS